MPTGEDKLQARAIQAGLRAAKMTHQVPSEQELRKLKVQILPGVLRLILFASGIAMLLAGLTAWPIDDVAKQVLLDIAGALTAVFSIFGVRRSLGAVLDTMSAEGAGALLELVFTIIGDLLGA